MRERHVAPVAADVGEQFEKWKVMLDVPDEIGQKYQEGEQASEPDPGLEEHGAMFGKQQARNHAGGEEDDAILVLKGYARSDAEARPMQRVPGQISFRRVRGRSIRREAQCLHPRMPQIVGWTARSRRKAGVRFLRSGR